jgi:hypothetical protein
MSISISAVCEFQYIRLASNSSIFVLRQTFTDQNESAATVHPCDDIAVVCSKHSQTSQKQKEKKKCVSESDTQANS